MHERRERFGMPQRDPNFWQSVITALSQVWFQVYAAMMAAVVSVARGLQAGGKWRKNLLEAIICMSLVLAIQPVLEHFGLSKRLAVAFGVVVGFLGTQWIRERATLIADTAIHWWNK